ncbi:hypothetical protein BJ912DRAFT_89886 [Pholiota molesta]|nr:hypothetical protein BJ912DRAFT_89886 [Pholiota molesta]
MLFPLFSLHLCYLTLCHRLVTDVRAALLRGCRLACIPLGPMPRRVTCAIAVAARSGSLASSREQIQFTGRNFTEKKEKKLIVFKAPTCVPGSASGAQRYRKVHDAAGRDMPRASAPSCMKLRQDALGGMVSDVSTARPRSWSGSAPEPAFSPNVEARAGVSAMTPNPKQSQS